MANERINLALVEQEGLLGAILALAASGGDDAITATFHIVDTAPQVDKDAAELTSGWASLATLGKLDSLNIWDEKIYKLWNDVCGRDAMKVQALLRAHQLGELADVTRDSLHHAIEHHGEGIDLDSVIAAVVNELPGFNATPHVYSEAAKK